MPLSLFEDTSIFNSDVIDENIKSPLVGTRQKWKLKRLDQQLTRAYDFEP
jgi:hypothetical protein